MTDMEFDTALVSAAFSLGAAEGWRNVSPAAAARRAGLDLAATRQRYRSGRSAFCALLGGWRMRMR